MANVMKEVARLLGLELEEEFNIENFGEVFSKFKLTERGLLYWLKTDRKWCGPTDIPNRVLTGENKIVKIPKPVLDDKEKEYLGNIIKPFRDKVVSIAKYRYSDDNSYIQITVEQIAFDGELIDLPRFKSDAMYKGMRAGKQYTLEELGL